jgi:hypothetical protein
MGKSGYVSVTRLGQEKGAFFHTLICPISEKGENGSFRVAPQNIIVGSSGNLVQYQVSKIHKGADAMYCTTFHLQKRTVYREVLMARLQAAEGLTPQLILEVETLKEALGAPITPLKKALPFAYRLQRALFGQWEEIDDGTVRCPHCGSSLVSRKENTPRRKKYRHPESKEWCEVEGYRYYCLNPSCPFGSFTDYPEGVRLYSEWTVDIVVGAVMVYLHLRTTYRRAADGVGVSHVTLWRWAMVVGEQGLPIATLFGVVRSSGVKGQGLHPPGHRHRYESGLLRAHPGRFPWRNPSRVRFPRLAVGTTAGEGSLRQ